MLRVTAHSRRHAVAFLGHLAAPLPRRLRLGGLGRPGELRAAGPGMGRVSRKTALK